MAEDSLLSRDPIAQQKREASRQRLVRWRANNPEKVAAQRQRQYARRRDKDPLAKAQKRREQYERNKARESAQATSWRQMHPDEHRANYQSWLAAHYQERLAYNRAWRAANKEQFNADQRRRAKRNRAERPAIYRATEKRHRAMKYGAARVDLTLEQWQEMLIAYAYRCAYCGRRGTADTLEQEHLTPVTANGNYTVQNIVPACRSCNAHKGSGPVLQPVQPLLLTVAPPRKTRRNGQEE